MSSTTITQQNVLENYGLLVPFDIVVEENKDGFYLRDIKVKDIDDFDKTELLSTTILNKKFTNRIELLRLIFLMMENKFSNVLYDLEYDKEINYIVSSIINIFNNKYINELQNNKKYFYVTRFQPSYNDNNNLYLIEHSFYKLDHEIQTNTEIELNENNLIIKNNCIVSSNYVKIRNMH